MAELPTLTFDLVREEWELAAVVGSSGATGEPFTETGVALVLLSMENTAFRQGFLSVQA